MRTTYIKREPKNYWEQPTYYKVIQVSTEITKLVNVYQNEITIDEHEDYYHAIGFVTHTLCDGRYKIISREDFDKYYIEVAKMLNELASA